MLEIMRKSTYTHLPSLKRLLDSPVMAGACLVSGDAFLSQEIEQVAGPGDTYKNGERCLFVLDAGFDPAKLAPASALCLVAPGGAVMDKYIESKDVRDLTAYCHAIKAPLLILPGNGDYAQSLASLRSTLAELIQESTNHLHQQLFNTVLEKGIEGLIALVQEVLDKPISLESAEFKQLVSCGMKSTPSRQRKAITAFATDLLEALASGSEMPSPDYYRSDDRIVVPLIHNDKNLIGYLSCSIKMSENANDFLWILKPVALSCMVDLVQRSKSDIGLNTASKSLLKELISGQSLSSVELERVERHFGFDLYDGFFVFAIDALSKKGERVTSVQWPEDRAVSVEVEGPRVYVLPFHKRSRREWQEELQAMLVSIRARNKNLKFQVGASRPMDTILEFHEAYRQARQALIIGSMMHTGEECAIGYGELGLMRLLYLIVDHPEFEQFYQETLGPLEAYDKEWDTDLTETLKVYVEHGANLNSAARALYIHRNTMRYRLEQIEEDILKVDIDSQEVLLNLQVAYIIKQLRNR